MAIKIDGTTVITDAKQLANIASLDATTLSAISTGLGGAFSPTLLHTLDNPNVYSTGVDDDFGYSLASDGKYLAVAAKENTSAGVNVGVIYVYNILNGGLLHIIQSPVNQASEFFGLTLDISGNWLITGVWLNDTTGTDSGRAYIYNLTTGALHKTLENPNAYDTTAGDKFGSSVGISGNYAIVGAYDEDDANGTSSGKAYIFNIVTGTLVHTLDNPNAYGTSAGDNFGNAGDISGNYAIVGAPGEDDANGGSSGKAYIFNVSTGALVHTLNNPNPYGTSVNDNFAETVAISGNYAIVGAWGEDEAGGTSSGKAYIYNVSTGALVHTLNNPNAYGTVVSDYFGEKVDISGNYAIVNAIFEDDSDGTSSGKAYIYNVSTGALVDTLDNPNAYGTSTSDTFGKVTISGNYAAVGAYQEDDSSASSTGKVYVYSLVDPAVTSFVSREMLHAIA